MQISRALMFNWARNACQRVHHGAPSLFNAPFPADDAPFTFFSTKYVMSHQTRKYCMIGRVIMQIDVNST